MALLGLSCGMWDLVPPPGTEPENPALGVWRPSHWTMRKFLIIFFAAEDEKVLYSQLYTVSKNKTCCRSLRYNKD